MDTKLLDYVQFLSKEDTKTLSQKALKTSEEVGELSKAVLPFENAFATTHRFVEREKILEEAVDTVLTALSCAYDVGYNHDEIEQMMVRKAAKWRGLQVREQGLKYPIPFEIHVTVGKVELGLFKQVCEQAKVKPILLDLQNQDGNTVMEDLQTSSVCFGTNREAIEEVERIAGVLESAGIKVLRKKVETVPWHPAAPSRKSGVVEMPKDCYFESHIAILLPARSTERTRNYLQATAKMYGAHLSRNVFKKYEDGSSKIMMTYRDYKGPFEEFEIALDLLVRRLELADFKMDKVITEFSVYDTKVTHDSAWIESPA